MKKLKYIWLVLLLSSCQSSLTDKELDSKYLEAFETRNWQGAIEYLDKKIERNPKDAYAYYARAVATSNRRSKTAINQMINDLDISLELRKLCLCFQRI